MAVRFTDQHALALVAPSLYPGEQILFRARGFEKPWYSYLFLRLGAFLWRYWLVVATNQRVLFVQHAGLLGGHAAKRTEAFAWSELDHVRVGWGIFTRKLVAKVSGRGRRAPAVVIPRGWMRGNFAAAEGMARHSSSAAFGAGARSPARSSTL